MPLIPLSSFRIITKLVITVKEALLVSNLATVSAVVD
jgi:hypothetical protein